MSASTPARAAPMLSPDVSYGIATQTLPNGYCGLPVQKTCPHANACLTCPVFLTGPEFLPELREQRTRTLTLIDNAKSCGHSRMTEMNQQVADNLDRMIGEMEDDQETETCTKDALRTRWQRKAAPPAPVVRACRACEAPILSGPAHKPCCSKECSYWAYMNRRRDRGLPRSVAVAPPRQQPADCLVCGILLPERRSQSRLTCSASCRMKRYRARRKERLGISPDQCIKLPSFAEHRR
ncbi:MULTISPECIES: transposase [Streptomyces]|nr:transposase [Streptomyces avermitilis]BBJ56452.1 hypothetical protein SAVMC3_90810 [Streptomyces avermitilis]GDY70478.1 hypothetical protein SAV14893_098710 [Streptomyces avermitilis]GDY80793.1 hypothetical protein SAV31267_102780 [Streptomyces avermitilis]